MRESCSYLIFNYYPINIASLLIKFCPSRNKKPRAEELAGFFMIRQTYFDWLIM